MCALYWERGRGRGKGGGGRGEGEGKGRGRGRGGGGGGEGGVEGEVIISALEDVTICAGGHRVATLFIAF